MWTENGGGFLTFFSYFGLKLFIQNELMDNNEEGEEKSVIENR